MNALDRQRGGADDNSAQAGHIVASTLTERIGRPHHEMPMVVNAIQRRIHKGTDSDANHLVPSIGEHRDAATSLQAPFVGVRRLTPIETERLMSWPDGWTNPDGNAPDSRRYAACGDGVVSNVAEWIGRRILAEDAT